MILDLSTLYQNLKEFCKDFIVALKWGGLGLLILIFILVLISNTKDSSYDKGWHDGYDIAIWTSQKSENIIDWCNDCALIYMRDSGYTVDSFEAIYQRLLSEHSK